MKQIRELERGLFTGPLRTVGFGMTLIALGVSAIVASNYKSDKLEQQPIEQHFQQTKQLNGGEYTLRGLMEMYSSDLHRDVTPNEVLDANMSFYNPETGTFSKYTDLK